MRLSRRPGSAELKRLPRMLGIVWALSAASVFVFSACSGCGESDPTEAPPPTIDTVVFASPDEKVSVKVPRGTGAEPKITITQVSPSVPAEAAKKLVSEAYEITLVEGELTGPAVVTLNYDPAKLPSGAGTQSLVLAKLKGTEWETLPGSTVDETAKSVTAGVTSFSIFGVISTASTTSTGTQTQGPTTPPPATPLGDTTAPDTLITSKPVSLTSSASAQFAFASAESIVTYECQLDGSAWAACTSPVNYTSLAQGAHTFSVRAKDTAGNQDSSPASVTWTIDSTAPTAPDAAKITVVDNGSGTQDTLTGAAGCVEGGVAITVYTDSSLSQTIASATAASDGSFATIQIGDDQRDTQAYVYLTAGDGAGNVSSATSVRTDKTGPTATITSTPPSTTLNTNATFYFSVLVPETGVTYQCRVDSGASAVCTTPHTVSGLTAGSHTFYVKALDAYLNAGSEASYTWTIQSGPAAMDAVGQINGSTVVYTRGANGGLSSAEYTAVDVANRRLFVTDTANHRVLVYDLSTGYTLVDRYPEYVLGQPNHESTTSTATGSPLTSGFNTPRGIAVYNSMLFVADTLNNRVLMFDVRNAGSSSTAMCNVTTSGLADGMNASCVLGQPDMTTTTAATTQKGLNAPRGLSAHKDIAELYISDTGNHRVIVHNIATLSNWQTAVNVLGQANFTSGLANRGGGAGQNTLSSPIGLAYYHHISDGNQRRLLVSDQANNRVMVFVKGSGWVDGQNATNVLGQTSFGSTTPVTSATGLYWPSGAAFNEDTSRAYVADAGNNRVLVFDLGDGIVDGEAASNVLGQTSFSTNSSATPPTSASLGSYGAIGSITTLYGVFFTTTTLGYAVGSSGLLWYTSNGGALWAVVTSPTANDLYDVQRATGTIWYAVGASGVIIKTTDGSNWVAQNSGTGSHLRAVHFPANDQVGYAVGDGGVCRKTLDGGGTAWTQSTTSSPNNLNGVFFPAGSTVTGYAVGNTGTILKTADSGGTWTPQVPGVTEHLYAVHFPADANTGWAVGAAGRILYTANGGSNWSAQTSNTSNNLYTVYFADNTTGYAAGTGGTLLKTGNGGTTWTPQTSSTGYEIRGIHWPAPPDNTAYYVGGYRTVGKTTDGTSWSLMQVTTPSPTTIGLSFSENAYGRLYVSDPGNNRMQLFTVFPGVIVDGKAADDTIGHLDSTGGGDHTRNMTNNPTATHLFSPVGLALDTTQKRLFLTDSKQNRVLSFNLNSDLSLADRQADNVIGQTGQDALYVNSPGTTQRAGLNAPQGAAYDSVANRLFVADASNNRVLVYDVVSLSNGMNASFVLGQVNYVASSSGCTQTNMNQPRAVAMDTSGRRLYVADTGNNRVTIYNISTISDGMTAEKVLGQGNWTTCTPVVSQKRMSGPRGVAYDANTGRLIVSDTGSHRVLFFDVGSGASQAPTSDMLATYEVGQPSSFDTNTPGLSQSALNGPGGLALNTNQNSLYIADTNNNRVVVLSLASLSNGQSFVNVIGQTNFTTNAAATTSTGMRNPLELLYEPTTKRLYVADNKNNRFLIYDAN